jgi:hypothetical protein
MSSLEEALRLAQEAELDPVAAVQHIGEIARGLRSAVRGGGPGGASPVQHVATIAPSIPTLGVTHIVRVDSVPALNPGDTTRALKIDWPAGRGVVRSLYAGVVGGDPALLSSVSLRVSINGSEELVTTGEAEAYVPLVALQPQNHNWMRLADFDVSAQQRWTCFFRNEATTGPAVVPFLLFGYARVSP